MNSTECVSKLTLWMHKNSTRKVLTITVQKTVFVCTQLFVHHFPHFEVNPFIKGHETLRILQAKQKSFKSCEFQIAFLSHFKHFSPVHFCQYFSFFTDTVTKAPENWYAIAVVPKAPLGAVEEATGRSPVQVRLRKPQRKPRRRIRKTSGTRITRSSHIHTCKRP